MQKIAKISGFPEWLPEQKLAEDRVIAVIRKIYESFGFTPIETPAVELLSTLASKGVVDKEIFAVRRLKADEGEEAELALHFDLTVPFARYVAQHAHELNFPFKRYQLQKVWRGDRPQRGRFREFYQFDIDTIARDVLPLSCDAEVLTVVGLVMEALKFGPYVMRINSRKLLAGIYGNLGLESEQRAKAITAVDKILKIGADGVRAELEKIGGISRDAIGKILETTQVQCSIGELGGKLAALSLSSPEIDEGAQELGTICSLMPENLLSNVVIDLSLARGLDYYTGVILEVGMTNHPEFGTVVSGGRYENLASEFTEQKLPGVGVSIGLSRLLELAFTQGLIDTSAKCPTKALVTVYNEADRALSNSIAADVRAAGMPCEVYFRSPKLGKQIEYAESKGIRFVLFVDGSTKAIQVKDLVTKEQRAVESIGVWVQEAMHTLAAA